MRSLKVAANIPYSTGKAVAQMQHFATEVEAALRARKSMIYLEFFRKRRWYFRSRRTSLNVGADHATSRPVMGQNPMEQNWNNAMPDAICGKPARGRVEMAASV
jgi:hypothetical protein